MKNILILGAGYGGLTTLKGLKKVIKSGNVKVTLVNKNSYHYDTVNLHEVSAGNIKSDDAITMTKLLAKKYGLLVGISSGANAKAALNIAKKLGKGKVVVSILPDTGERYLTTGIYDI